MQYDIKNKLKFNIPATRFVQALLLRRRTCEIQSKITQVLHYTLQLILGYFLFLFSYICMYVCIYELNLID
jgi:hypothetical protein